MCRRKRRHDAQVQERKEEPDVGREERRGMGMGRCGDGRWGDEEAGVFLLK